MTEEQFATLEERIAKLEAKWLSPDECNHFTHTYKRAFDGATRVRCERCGETWPMSEWDAIVGESGNVTSHD